MNTTEDPLGLADICPVCGDTGEIPGTFDPSTGVSEPCPCMIDAPAE